MSEHEPIRLRAPKQPAAEGSLEGNVLIPQTYLGASLFGLEKVLASEDPKKAIIELVAPIPLDDARLLGRTKKAQAQHELHRIPVKLAPGDVRNIQIDGNSIMLRILARTLMPHELIPSMMSGRQVNEKGEWALAGERQLADELADEVTPERAAYLRQLLGAAVAVLRRPEVAVLLKERKAVFQDWGSVKIEERDERLRKTSEIFNMALNELQAALEPFVENARSDEERETAGAFLDILTDIFKRKAG